MLYKVNKNVVQHAMMYNLFSFIVQLLLFLAQFVQCCTQYCTQGAPPPSLCRCSCAQPGLLVLYASTRAQVHHHHADYIIAVRRARQAPAPALPAGAPARPPSAPALARLHRNRDGVLGQNCFFIYLCTAASDPAAKAAVPAMVQIASSGCSPSKLASAPA